MNAINSTSLFERLDFGAIRVQYALSIIRAALAGEKDADLYGRTMGEAEKALQDALTDLKAAGAGL